MIITHRKKSVRSAVSIPSKPVIAEDDGYDGEYWGWDGDRWLHTFYGDVEAKVADKFQSMVWNSDDENVYLDIAGKDGTVTQYTIPFEDLSFNFNKMDESVEYVVEEILSDLPVESSVKASAEFYDMGTGLEYWYFTTHGVQPGSVPKGLEILDVIDKPEGSYFLTNRVISTDALKYYDIKERSPR